MNENEFANLLKASGVHVSDDMLSRFSAYKAALYAFNAHRNVTRIPIEECNLRHFVDCTLFQDLLPQGASVLDIGTGPGLPAWVLANIRPDLEITALDSSGKMLDFLRSQPLPNLLVVEDRAESWGVTERFDVVTGRAVAPLSMQLELSARPTKIGGMVLPMRTAQDEDTISQLSENPFGLELITVHKRVLPVLEAMRLFPVFRKGSKTPREYPRSWAEIRKKPI